MDERKQETELEEFLPDGWKDGDAYPLEEESDGEGVQEAREASDGGAASEDGGGAGSALKASAAEENGAGETAAGDDKTDGTGETNAENSGNNEAPAEDSSTDYKALYEAELQRQRDAADEAKYREVYRQQREAGMTDAIARMVAANECGGRSFDLSSPAQREGAPEQSGGAPSSGGGTLDFGRDFVALKELYPDVGKIPDSVLQSYSKGQSLSSAYSAWRAGEDARTIASLRQEVAQLKSNASVAARAPVRGVTGGGGGKPPAKDDFTAGFDDEWR